MGSGRIAFGNWLCQDDFSSESTSTQRRTIHFTSSQLFKPSSLTQLFTPTDASLNCPLRSALFRHFQPTPQLSPLKPQKPTRILPDPLFYLGYCRQCQKEPFGPGSEVDKYKPLPVKFEQLGDLEKFLKSHTQILSHCHYIILAHWVLTFQLYYY